MIWRCWLRNRQWNCPCGRDRSKNATLRTTDGASRGEKVMPSSGISFPEMSRKTCLFLTLPFTMWYGRGELWAGVIRADNPKCLHQRETSARCWDRTARPICCSVLILTCHVDVSRHNLLWYPAMIYVRKTGGTRGLCYVPVCQSPPTPVRTLG